METYWIVGGSKGIGRAIAERLVETGNRVVCFSRSGEAPSEATPWHLDLGRDEEDIEGVMLSAMDALGVPTKVVLSAGMGAYHRLDKWRASDVQTLFRANCFGPLLVARRLALEQRRQKKGHILFIGSTVTEHGANALGVYAASKAGCEAWVKSECRHLAKRNVWLGVLKPGWVESEMTADIQPDLKAAIVKSIPLKRMGTCEEVASVAWDMLKWPIYSTGTVVEIAGGVS